MWNALVTGGDVSINAIAAFTELCERDRKRTLEQLFHQAESFVDNLIVEETKGNRHDFRTVKEKLIRVLEALPYLVVTDALREEATKRLAELDKRSEPLTNIDIAMKCDEVAKKLKPQSLEDLTAPTPQVIQCSSLEDLKEKLTGKLPPEAIDDIISEIEKSGGGILFGFQAIIKKRPSQEN